MGTTNLPTRRYAFINMPYATRYERVYLAFIAGAAGHGLWASAAVHDPSSRYQLDRIYDLIARAQVSLHDYPGCRWIASRRAHHA